MNSPWEHIIRLVAGGLAAILVYQIAQRFVIRLWGKLQRTSLNYGFRCFSCLLAMIAFAMIIEDSGIPWTYEWWQEVLFKGDWIFVMIASPILALGPWMLEKRERTSLIKMDFYNDTKN